MSWRIGIRHQSGYRYSGEVTSSYNEARITPLSTHRQVVMESDVTIVPTATSFRYWDYWSSLVHAFDIHVPHTELAVTGTSAVVTSPPAEPPAAIGWQELSAADAANRYAELLAPTAHVPIEDELVSEARGLAEGRSPLEACQAAGEWARSKLRYEKGATTVSTSALESLRRGSGVCQDFAHVTLALMRAMGIPARYTSGYLHPSAGAGVGEAVVGQSHAWVEAWVGDWVAFDPTNGGPVGERHVVVARARDYADVSPLKGIYHGGRAEALQVTVELTRLA